MGGEIGGSAETTRMGRVEKSSGMETRIAHLQKMTADNKFSYPNAHGPL